MLKIIIKNRRKQDESRTDWPKETVEFDRRLFPPRDSFVVALDFLATCQGASLSIF